MNKNEKISYYSLDDINKIGIVDNINCSEKSFFRILEYSIPYLVTLIIIEIILASKGITIIVFILLSIIIFSFLFSRHVYDRFINFKLSINNKKISYKNEVGKVFNYNESSLLYATYHRWGYNKRRREIKIYMDDGQKISVYDEDRHFYKLMTYLESKELFKK